MDFFEGVKFLLGVAFDTGLLAVVLGSGGRLETTAFAREVGSATVLFDFSGG